MKLGYASWNLQADELAPRVKAVGECGFAAISFYLTPQKLQQPDEAEEVIRLVEQYDLEVTCHNALGTIDKGDRWAQLRQEVADIVAWQQTTGRIKVISCDPGYDAVDDSMIFDLDLSVARLQYIIDLVAPLGIQVAIENWLINPSLDFFEAIGERLGKENVGMLLDLGHLNLSIHHDLIGGMTAYEYIIHAPLDILEVHLHSNDGKEDQHRPLREGTVDYRTMARALADRGFNGFATVEHGGPLDDPKVVERIQDTAHIFAAAYREACE